MAYYPLGKLRGQTPHLRKRCFGNHNVPNAYGEKTVVEMASDEVRCGGNGPKRIVKASRVVAEKE